MHEASLTFEMSLSMSVRFDLISFMKSHRFADVHVTDTKPCKKTRSICRDDEANIKESYSFMPHLFLPALNLAREAFGRCWELLP